MLITFGMVARDLEAMYPELKDNLVFKHFKVLAGLRTFRDQGIEVDGLKRDYDEYVKAGRPTLTVKKEVEVPKASDLRKRLLED